MKSVLAQKYTLLKTAATELADIEVVNDLMVDILQLLREQFSHTTGNQRAAYEQAYSLLNCTMTAHYVTKQDTHNPYYVCEMSSQIGRDIAAVLPVSA